MRNLQETFALFVQPDSAPRYLGKSLRTGRTVWSAGKCMCSARDVPIPQTAVHEACVMQTKQLSLHIIRLEFLLILVSDSSTVASKIDLRDFTELVQPDREHWAQASKNVMRCQAVPKLTMLANRNEDNTNQILYSRLADSGIESQLSDVFDVFRYSITLSKKRK